MASLINNDKIKVPYLRDLSHALNKVQELGYRENFKATEDGLLSLDTEKKYSADQISLVNFYRFEGISDPDDSSILYVIETSDGAKGTLTNAYGMYADPLVDKIMSKVKKTEPD